MGHTTPTLGEQYHQQHSVSPYQYTNIQQYTYTNMQRHLAKMETSKTHNCHPGESYHQRSLAPTITCRNIQSSTISTVMTQTNFKVTQTGALMPVCNRGTGVLKCPETSHHCFEMYKTVYLTNSAFIFDIA